MADEGRQRERAALLSAYRSVFDTPEGQLILRDLMVEAGMTSRTFADPGAMDGMAIALRAARRDGMRSLVLYILAQRETPISKVFDDLEEMIRHAQERRTHDAGTGTLDWAAE